MSLDRAAAFVKKYDNFLITAHTNPEGDALGSELAFWHLLKKLRKNAFILNEDDIPGPYAFLPGLEAVRRYKKNMRGLKFDCFAVLDCSDLHRTGEVYRIAGRGKRSLNIDHHISNRSFADVNWVDAKASSCSEMIYRLYRKLNVPFCRRSALCLYTGMVTDTGSFKYTNTTAATHRAVADLMQFGIDAAAVYRAVYESLPYRDVKFLSSLFPLIRRDKGGRVIWFTLARRLLKGQQLTIDLTEHILSFARAVKGVEVVALFKENPGAENEIRVNLRSQGCVDVNRIAQSVGGGGHRTASGATVKGTLAQVRRRVLKRIREELP